ncbi:hypothetical protein ACS0TY_003204 [Phlomoides rotata]
MCNHEERIKRATATSKRSITTPAVATLPRMETSECIISMTSTVVVLYPLGYIMGLLIPQRMVYYPMFGLEFSTNQGPFALKEYAMISILANMGATIDGFTSYFVDGFGVLKCVVHVNGLSKNSGLDIVAPLVDLSNT